MAPAGIDSELLASHWRMECWIHNNGDRRPALVLFCKIFCRFLCSFCPISSSSLLHCSRTFISSECIEQRLHKNKQLQTVTVQLALKWTINRTRPESPENNALDAAMHRRKNHYTIPHWTGHVSVPPATPVKTYAQARGSRYHPKSLIKLK